MADRIGDALPSGLLRGRIFEKWVRPALKAGTQQDRAQAIKVLERVSGGRPVGDTVRIGGGAAGERKHRVQGKLDRPTREHVLFKVLEHVWVARGGRDPADVCDDDPGRWNLSFGEQVCRGHQAEDVAAAELKRGRRADLEDVSAQEGRDMIKRRHLPFRWHGLHSLVDLERLACRVSQEHGRRREPLAAGRQLAIGRPAPHASVQRAVVGRALQGAAPARGARLRQDSLCHGLGDLRRSLPVAVPLISRGAPANVVHGGRHVAPGGGPVQRKRVAVDAHGVFVATDRHRSSQVDVQRRGGDLRHGAAKRGCAGTGDGQAPFTRGSPAAPQQEKIA